MYRIEFPSRQADRIRCSNTRWPSTRKGAAKKKTKPKTPMIESIDGVSHPSSELFLEL